MVLNHGLGEWYRNPQLALNDDPSEFAIPYGWLFQDNHDALYAYT